MPSQTISVCLSSALESVAQSQLAVFRRHLRARGWEVELVRDPGRAQLSLGLDPTLELETYRIAGAQAGISITGGDPLGLLYGLGKYLRTSRFEPGVIIPTPWRGISAPKKKVRGIYFATHFHNFYQDAPLEAVEQYIEDIALWGFNVLSVWFDMHTYTGIEDPRAQALLDRLKALLRAAKRIGLQTALTTLANEAYAKSPVELRADWTAGHDGYFRPPGGHYHVELCPSKPGATELIFEWRRQVFAAFQETGLDYIWIWPYDQGGCTCALCAPWGANGFLRLAQPLADLARDFFPGIKVVLSTWYFDLFTAGEWEGLARSFQENGAGWADYLMADFVGGGYPEFLLQHGVPGGLPLLGFPEISMYGATPWGGFGANPYPGVIAALWAKAAALQTGGFPYSEGIFEDMNKAVCAQLYWDPGRSPEEILKEYIAYEFSPEVIEPVLEAIRLLEKTLPRRRVDEAGIYHDYPVQGKAWLGEQRFILSDPHGVEQAWKLLNEAHESLPGWARAAWRWRILYLRGLIDRELITHQYTVSQICETALRELVEIYHAQNADYCVSPPTREAIDMARGALSEEINL